MTSSLPTCGLGTKLQIFGLGRNLWVEGMYHVLKPHYVIL